MSLANLNIVSPVQPLRVPKQDYRDAMARLGAAVNIVTTDGPQGRAGFTATAVCSVTDEPPTLLVCLNRSASVYPIFKANGTLCVNTLSSEHKVLSNLFGGKTGMEERFATACWNTLITGSPALEGAVVSFDCRIVSINTVGTHDVLLCEVVAIERQDDVDGLVYFNRSYQDLLTSAPCG
ncbi:pyrimidine utilization flavin reductase protein F [Pseudomonas luteola]|uniref:NADH-dependent FMN reductase RutF n=1 Tax=Pseudomonas luteola TaxID=47886 RepID=UPI001EF66375|nr:pyrimidine utilization flavin reductase protein F [Pseudomonas luteola]MCG7372819.1 pyrimidine utilization flavin reductase protein F [Pseudomonas luteola]